MGQRRLLAGIAGRRTAGCGQALAVVGAQLRIGLGLAGGQRKGQALGQA